MTTILVLGTGGTIVSQPEDQGLKPRQQSEALDNTLRELGAYYRITYKSILNLDSSNIQMEEWQTIAHHVHENLEAYDGIVITHGTDTMAYTASVLSFMLQNCGKPVVLTGSQLPIHHPLTDAKNNLALAMMAVEQGIGGVSIAFHHKIIKGCRAVKIRTMGLDAFESVNYPYLAEFSSGGLHTLEQPDRQGPRKSGSLRYAPELCNDVFLLKLIPGTNPTVFDSLMDLNYRGFVLEAFGIGGLHFLRRDLLSKIGTLIQDNRPVVVCSQCLYERSDFSVYETGRKVLEIGAIQGFNMTTEAAVTKLMWALGQTRSMEEIRSLFLTNLVGEVDLPE